jgi:hypothetical protein
VNCWDTFTFNTSTCTWDNDGTAKPAAPEKSELLGYFYFQQSTCTWDNDGTTQPAAPEKTVGILLLSTILLVLGIMMEQQTCSKKK